jgi:branched-chain amino acid transport system substrate-binding protein
MTTFSAGRRRTLRASAALASSLATGFPAVLKAQSDAVRIGHLTPRTGFLGLIAQYG